MSEKTQSAKNLFFKRKKGCPLSGSGKNEVNYKNISLIGKFVSEKGKILPRRITSVSAKKQRELKRAIKRARNIALLPYVKL